MNRVDVLAALRMVIGSSHLIVNEKLRKNALNNKAIGFYPMTPNDFISLTASSSDQDYIRKKAKPLEFYNDLIESGEIQVHPFLDYDKNGKIKRHEGRHRAQAVLNSGGNEFWVALYPDQKHRNYNTSDLPDQLKGQTSHYTLPVDHSRVEWIEANMEDNEVVASVIKPKATLKHKGYSIRLFDFSDHTDDEIITLINDAGADPGVEEEYWPEILSELVTITKGSKIVGYARFHGDSKVEDILIDENHRRQGLATAVYDLWEKTYNQKLRPHPLKNEDADEFWKSRRKVTTKRRKKSKG